MKRIFQLLFLVFLAQSTLSAQETDSVLIYKFDIKEMIAPAAWRHTMRSIDEAEQMKADYILIHMNTYGGLVDAADSIRTKLINSSIPSIVFIDNNAASAGALISIACDSIYMRPGGNIGAATVVSQDGQAMPDKYQSYMRSTMRSTAESHGKRTKIIDGDTISYWHRDPNIAEAMVDPSVVVEGVSAEGKVLTFTTSEAMKNHFCEGQANTITEVLEKAGIKNYRIYEKKLTLIDTIIGWLINPAVSGILIMIMLGGIYFELQSPGVGFPLAAAGLAALLYFTPLFLEGIADHWEIALFLFGIVLIALEVFVIPGFGIAGILGILCMGGGLVLSMVDNNVIYEMGEFNPNPIAKASFVVVISFLIGFLIMLFTVQKLFSTGLFKNLVLEKSQQKEEGFSSVDTTEEVLVGKTAQTYTALRPSGKIIVDGEIYDAKSVDTFIDKDVEVKIVRFLHGQLYVRTS